MVDGNSGVPDERRKSLPLPRVGKGRVWVTSDWHLGHKKIVDFEESRQPGFEEELFLNAVTRIRSADTTWFLGDICFHRKWLPTFRKIPGRKLLVLGNHDRFSRKSYYEAGFEVVVPDYAWHVRPSGEQVLLSHYPAVTGGEDQRYRPERGRLKALRRRTGQAPAVNYHGHIHSRVLPDKGLVNVSPEVNDYRPVLLEA